MAKIKAETLTLTQYLAQHNRKRTMDKVLKKYFLKKDPMNPSFTKEQWDAKIEAFYKETE